MSMVLVLLLLHVLLHLLLHMLPQLLLLHELDILQLLLPMLFPQKFHVLLIFTLLLLRDTIWSHHSMCRDSLKMLLLLLLLLLLLRLLSLSLSLLLGWRRWRRSTRSLVSTFRSWLGLLLLLLLLLLLRDLSRSLLSLSLPLLLVALPAILVPLLASQVVALKEGPNDTLVSLVHIEALGIRKHGVLRHILDLFREFIANGAIAYRLEERRLTHVAADRTTMLGLVGVAVQKALSLPICILLVNLVDMRITTSHWFSKGTCISKYCLLWW
jgi:hypothetical protein